MPIVFISHSNQDNEHTLRVSDGLRRAGYDVWVDYEHIRGGADWLCEIQAGIQRCAAVVVILSPASAASVWVERECLYAFQLNKPVITALIADVLIPLHLINFQYCDLRADHDSGVVKLLDGLKHLISDGTPTYRAMADTISRTPDEANFFPYIEQLPAGEPAALVARDLFSWARGAADEVVFGGRARPGFHARIRLDGRPVTIFSVWAYRRKPSAQLPLDRLARHGPFDKLRVRRAALEQLNQLLPTAAQFNAQQADRRPTFALRHLSSAERLEAFKSLVLEISRQLRGELP